MLFQIRDDDPAVIDRLEDLLRSMAADVSARGPCTVAVERIRTGAPAMMDASFQHAIEAASKKLAGGKSIRMPSAAGHDAQILSTIMPSGMLFVPSIGGISHHWTENTDDADIVTGAEVFVDACRRLLSGLSAPSRCTTVISVRLLSPQKKPRTMPGLLISLGKNSVLVQSSKLSTLRRPGHPS